MNEILLVDKPAGWTSFDVVAKVRSTLNTKYSIQNTKRIRVGHAGTLDPFATGLLIVLVGDATKNQDQFMKLDKQYEATLKFGYTSTTGDPEGKITSALSSRGVERRGDLDCHASLAMTDIQNVLEKFIGENEQVPPAFSAIKVNGKRAYKLAREGKKFELAPRKVKISELGVINYSWPELKIVVSCSSGTYIRTLAEDIGKALGCGAYLTNLRRIKIGKYDVSNAETVDKIVMSFRTCPPARS